MDSLKPRPSNGTTSPLQRALDDFGHSRLLAFDRDAATRGPTVEVSHEALLREWPLLRGWLRESRGEVRLQRQLAQAASEWGAANQDPSFLLTGARLALFEAWRVNATVALTADERALIDASLVERERRAVAEAARAAREAALQRRARRILQALVAVFLGAAVIAGGLAWWADDRRVAAEVAEEQALSNLSMSEAQRLAAESNRLFIERRDLDVAALLALRSIGLGYSPQGDEALSRAARQIYVDRLFRQNTGQVTGIAFSADGRLAATGANASAPLVWEAETGTLLFRLDTCGDGASSIDMSADGKWIASGSGNAICVWSGETGEEIYRREYTAQVSGVDISTDERLLLVVGWDKIVRVLDLASGEERQQLEQPNALLGGKLSPDDRLVLIGDVDGRVRLWDWRSNEMVLDLTVVGWPWGLAFAPDMSTFSVASFDKLAYIFETDTGALLYEIPQDDVLYWTATYSPDGRYMTTADQRGVIHLWDVQTGQEARRFSHTLPANVSAFTPEGQFLVTGIDDGTISFWDLQARPAQIDIAGAGHMEGKIAFTSDGEELLSHGRVFDSHTGARGPDTGVVEGFSALSRDGRTAMILNWHPFEIRVLDPRTWATRLVQPVECMEQPYGIGISPDGSLIAIGSFNAPYKICVYDSQSGEVVRVIDNVGLSHKFAFTADNRILLSAECWAGTHLFDVSTGAVIRSLQETSAPGSCSSDDVSVSPDGTLILTGGYSGVAELWELSTGKLLRTFVGHTDIVWSATFSPDGRTVLTGSADGTARLWDIATGVELRRFSGHIAGVWGAAFSPDGRRVATTSSDDSVKLWLTNLDELTSAVCDSLPRDLTATERENYGVTDSAPTCLEFSSPSEIAR